jgi:N-acylglucosamine 2-epimerase
MATFIGNHIPAEQAESLRQQYSAALFQDVIPWWMEHSLDPEYGGFYSLLERDGRPWATDKYIWMHGRQVWMLSHLCNAHESRQEWRDAARLGADFLRRYAFKDDGQLHFRLTRDGQSRSEVLSLYTEVFVAIALAEYSHALQDHDAWNLATSMYDRLVPRLGEPTDTAFLGYPIHAQFHLHVHDMCRITVAWVFRLLQADDRFHEDLNLSVDSILRRHWHPELEALLENVAVDGTPLLDLPEGRMFHPGHAIESVWMLMEIARLRGDEELLNTSIQILRASLKQGWDEQYGGLRYITNIDNTPPHTIEADMKLWWPHCEALYALLLAWDLTGEEEFARWYDKLHDYAFGSFADPEFGEWFGYLNRDGSRLWTAKANGWKGCFHLPRVLFRAYQLLTRS